VREYKCIVATGDSVFFRDGYYERFDARFKDDEVEVNYLDGDKLTFDKDSKVYKLIKRIEAEKKVRSEVDLYDIFFYERCE